MKRLSLVLLGVSALVGCRLISVPEVSVVQSPDHGRHPVAVSPETHSGEQRIQPRQIMKHISLRAKKGTRFDRHQGVSLSGGYSAGDGADDDVSIHGSPCSEYGHLWLGIGQRGYGGHECCRFVLVARITPQKADIWFDQDIEDDFGVLSVSVGGQSFNVATPVAWPESAVPVKECLVLNVCQVYTCEEYDCEGCP